MRKGLTYQDEDILQELINASKQLIASYEYELRDKPGTYPEIKRTIRAVSAATKWLRNYQLLNQAK